MENEKNWGGKRAGAGRKKGSGVKFYSFKAPQEVVDVLESVEGTKADFIIRSILAYAENKTDKKAKPRGANPGTYSGPILCYPSRALGPRFIWKWENKQR